MEQRDGQSYDRDHSGGPLSVEAPASGEGVRATVKTSAKSIPFLLFRMKASLNDRRPGFREELEKIIAEVEEENRSKSL